MRWKSRFLTVSFLCSVATASAALLSPTSTAADKAGTKDGEWVQLFNGKDFSGWDRWLGKPYNGKEIIGLNPKQDNVYSIVEVDGQPAIRISGEIYGALTTQKEFEDYHIRLEFKWGQKTWPPRENMLRDSGLLYHCVGNHGAARTFWMNSLECQIMEGTCGDYFCVAEPDSKGVREGGPVVDTEGERGPPRNYVTYKKGGTRHKDLQQRIIREADHEKPHGQWNTIEVLTARGDAVHVVNGKVNMRVYNIRRLVDGKTMPLTKGKIQLQSEGAEVFYRNIAIRPIQEIPAEYR